MYWVYMYKLRNITYVRMYVCSSEMNSIWSPKQILVDAEETYMYVTLFSCIIAFYIKQANKLLKWL